MPVVFGYSLISTQVYLPEFLDNIKDPVPNKVRLFFDFENEQLLPGHLISEDMTLDRLYMETSIIASPLSEEELHSPSFSTQRYNPNNTVDMPIS